MKFKIIFYRNRNTLASFLETLFHVYQSSNEERRKSSSRFEDYESLRIFKLFYTETGTLPEILSIFVLFVWLFRGKALSKASFYTSVRCGCIKGELSGNIFRVRNFQKRIKSFRESFNSVYSHRASFMSIIFVRIQDNTKFLHKNKRVLQLYWNSFKTSSKKYHLRVVRNLLDLARSNFQLSISFFRFPNIWTLRNIPTDLFDEIRKKLAWKTHVLLWYKTIQYCQLYLIRFLALCIYGSL